MSKTPWDHAQMVCGYLRCLPPPASYSPSPPLLPFTLSLSLPPFLATMCRNDSRRFTVTANAEDGPAPLVRPTLCSEMPATPPRAIAVVHALTDVVSLPRPPAATLSVPLQVLERCLCCRGLAVCRPDTGLSGGAGIRGLS